MRATRIGQYVVSSEVETFRIFPRDRHDQTRPVTIHRTFLRLRDLRSGITVEFKRYLHQGQWYWRDSRDTRPCFERDVLVEVAAMLFGSPASDGGDHDRRTDLARDLLVAAITDREAVPDSVLALAA